MIRRAKPGARADTKEDSATINRYNMALCHTAALRGYADFYL